MAGLNHPNIAAIFDFGQVPAEAAEASGGRLEADSPFVIMERPAAARCTRTRRPTGRRCASFLLSLLDALSHAHARGIVHRDLKPANILWCNEQDLRPGPKLTDFGIAHIFEPGVAMDTVLRTQGAPQYMAPEQIRGQWRDYGP